jgi:hypothetical protein
MHACSLRSEKKAPNMEIVSVCLGPGVDARTVRSVTLNFSIKGLLLEWSDRFRVYPHFNTINPSLHAKHKLIFLHASCKRFYRLF